VNILEEIRTELQNETCQYFANGWRRFYNTIETLVNEAEPGSRVLDLGGDVSNRLERPAQSRHPYSFGHYFHKAGVTARLAITPHPAEGPGSGRRIVSFLVPAGADLGAAKRLW